MGENKIKKRGKTEGNGGRRDRDRLTNKRQINARKADRQTN